MQIIPMLFGVYGAVQNHMVQHFDFLLTNTTRYVVPLPDKVQNEGYVTGALLPRSHQGKVQTSRVIAIRRSAFLGIFRAHGSLSARESSGPT